MTSYPDFKSSFPKWIRDTKAPLCTNLKSHGLDLLESMLIYDPAGRISAKQAVNHPYFDDFVLPPQALPVPRANGFYH